MLKYTETKGLIKVLKKNRGLALILLILGSVSTALLIAYTGRGEFWHFFEVLAVMAALFYFVPGALISVLVALVVSIVFLPLGMEQLIDFTELIIMAVLVGWFAGRENFVRVHLSKMLMVDRLTGLHNYSYFIDRLEEEKKRADRFGSRLSLIMIDIDNFKPFNDKYGHRMGNELLIHLSNTFLSEVREIDIVCRYGGEEFAVILPNTSNEAAEVAERMRKAVEKNPFYADNGTVEKKTISAGVATYPKDALDEIQLIDKADEALYKAKEKGRNLVVIFEEIATAKLKSV